MATITVKQFGGDYTTLNAAFANSNDGDEISIEGTWSVDDYTPNTAFANANDTDEIFIEGTWPVDDSTKVTCSNTVEVPLLNLSRICKIRGNNGHYNG